MKSCFGKSFPHEDSPAVGLGPREVGLSPSLQGFMPWFCKALSSGMWFHKFPWAFPGKGLGLETQLPSRLTPVLESCDFQGYNHLPQVCDVRSCNPEGWQSGRLVVVLVHGSDSASCQVKCCIGMWRLEQQQTDTWYHTCLVLYPPPYPNHGLSKNKSIFTCWWMIKLVSVSWD